MDFSNAVLTALCNNARTRTPMTGQSCSPIGERTPTFSQRFTQVSSETQPPVDRLPQGSTFSSKTGLHLGQVSR